MRKLSYGCLSGLVCCLVSVGITSCSENTSPEPEGPIPSAGDFIDLGLSVKWASCNIGASSPDGYGDYYGWAEVITYYLDGQAQMQPPVWKPEYNPEGYIQEANVYYNTSLKCYSKYTSTDSIKNLEKYDDVAQKKSKGRMPSAEEWQELIDGCQWTWTTYKGVRGYNVAGKKTGYTDKSIFIPSSGSRVGKELYASGTDTGICYWSSSLQDGLDTSAKYLYADNLVRKVLYADRFFGMTIRPVKAE